MLFFLQLGQEISVRYDHQKEILLHVGSTDVLGAPLWNVGFIGCTQFEIVMLQPGGVPYPEMWPENEGCPQVST